MHENCTGCLSLHIESLTLKCGTFGARFHKCPCKECLVKGMCRNRCDDLEEFEDYINRKMPTVRDAIKKRSYQEGLNETKK